ncbi:MAG: hypothetical protein HZB61_12565 [Nitrospirae bacterium]|nr:hypothetical protein [Nitrospirota bacterium]
MKKILSVVRSLVFVFAVTSMSFAAEKQEAAKYVQVTGEITAVDAAANTLTVKGKKGDVSISVDELRRLPCFSCHLIYNIFEQIKIN